MRWPRESKADSGTSMHEEIGIIEGADIVFVRIERKRGKINRTGERLGKRRAPSAYNHLISGGKQLFDDITSDEARSA